MTCHSISKPRIAITVLVHALLTIPLLTAVPSPLPVSAPEAEAWIRHTVPLPKQIEIKQLVKVHADGLQQATAALPEWEATVRRQGDASGFTAKPVDVIRGMVEQMQKLQTELGL